MSSYSKFWASSSEIAGFLKGSVGDWVTGNMLVANRWAHTGVRDPGLFRSEEQRGLFWKVCLQKETKEGGNGQQRIYSGNSVCRRRQRKGGNGGYLCLGPFILAMGSFDGLTSNFSCPITCFEAIFLFISSFQCFSYLWTSINPRFLGLCQVPPVPRVCIGSPGAVTLLLPFMS
jgi:hypothetical protein